MSHRYKKSDTKPPPSSPKISPSVSKQEVELLKEKTIQLVLKNPAKSATILSEWINRGSTPKPSKK
jgi:hypothetical protein